ncbi:MAG TPA: acetyl-CoA hydrolase/transferase C-terminal domain-containing protein [Rhizomicrobium sp.]|jgi:acyl-CoA hydrolase|nr:acetyl-CoA hydrolase/transferase C-terminal domain-containing protein [Rhizomicrobium sp.]
MPQSFSDPDALADAIIRDVGKKIVLALPLGLGKACHVANALFARAVADPSINLHIFTALTLEKPRGKSELEKRFLDPVIDRLFGGYPELSYVKALRSHTLPPNIEVNEFFFLAGKWLNNPVAQQSYISANYTHAFRYVLERGVNVIGQLVAKKDGRYSLSCNTDTALDLLKARAAGVANFRMVGQVNAALPFMPGEGDLDARAFEYLLESPAVEFPMFAPPKEPLALSDYAIGLNIARLVPDGGTLQIGIGQEGDATVQGLILRHKHNAVYREAIDRLAPNVRNPLFHEDDPFDVGLYGCSEMFVDGFLELMRAGILKREVDGALLHGGFFLGTNAFYKELREMPDAQLKKIQMVAVSYTNQLYGDEAGKTRARVKARFVNSALMATLMGAAVSDGLEDGHVVSGVGGQFNFVDQAFALPDGRSVLTVKSTRTAGGKTTSNIRWSYGHETIPRHLRDIVVTEYGVANLRGKTDADTIAAMLSVADARYQDELQRAAVDAGKLPRTFQLAPEHRDNTPEHIAKALGPLRARGVLPEFPFGTDFTDTELRLMPVLERLQAASASTPKLLGMALSGAFAGAPNAADAEGLTRMGFDKPQSLKDRFYRALIRGAQTKAR